MRSRVMLLMVMGGLVLAACGDGESTMTVPRGVTTTTVAVTSTIADGGPVVAAEPGIEMTRTGGGGIAEATVTVPAAPNATDSVPVPDAAGGWVFDPALSGEDRVVLVSEWADERSLLTGDDVVAALGESTTKSVDAASPEVANYPDYWGYGFLFPFPSSEAVIDAGVTYQLHKQGDSRNVVMGVSEYVIYGSALTETFARMEWEESQRNTPDEQYAPAPIGVDAFAFETDGGSGAIHHLVVVNTGSALVVIATGPASPNYPEAALTESENLTRAQVDNLVRIAVGKLSGEFEPSELTPPAETAAASVVFDFSQDSICDWFTDDRVAQIVADAQEASGVQMDFGINWSCQGPLDSIWSSSYAVVELRRAMAGVDFSSHEMLDQSVTYSAVEETKGGYNLLHGIRVGLAVEGHEEIGFRFVAYPGPGASDLRLSEKTALGLAIANSMLRDMNWVP